MSEQEPQYSDILVSRRAGLLKTQRRRRLLAAIDAAELEKRPGARVLDLGCADGILWPDIRDRVGTIVGTNYDDWLTQQCRRRWPEDILLRADARRLPFADASFDLIFCLEAYHYIPFDDRVMGIQEMHRVLRPGGRLVLAVPIEVGVPGLIKFLMRVATRGCWPNVSAHFHHLWRRVCYKFVDIDERNRKINFHFDCWKLNRQTAEVFGGTRVRTTPFLYPFITNAIIAADKR